MPAKRDRAMFRPISPDFDLKALVESTDNFSYVDRISVEMIGAQGMEAFEKLVLLHVIIGGKPLVIDGFEDSLDPWTFTPKWLRDNCGDKQEVARDLKKDKSYLSLTMSHYLNNMGMLTNQFDEPGEWKSEKRQRLYLKDIDCPNVWQDKLKENLPSNLFYLNESTGEPGGPGAVPDPNNVSGRKLGKGIAHAGDLMSSLPPDMRAENLMCYIGHEGTYTPAHREMCASMGQNIMVEASSTVSDDGRAEKPGSSIWFMTESKDRHTVSEYFLSVLGHDVEVENHFAQTAAWKRAPFKTYVVEQRPGDFILIPPLAPHQVWNRGTRTIKVAWNRTTVETLEMALNEALPRSRIVCREEQYKNKAIVYYTLQKYSSLLTLAHKQISRMPPDAGRQMLVSGKIKQLAKDFRKLFKMYKEILISEMFDPDDKEAPKSMEYLPFDSNVTCAYCRGNVFNRFLTCPCCKDLLGHSTEESEGDPYDVCMECYAMGRSCGCTSNLKWVEQFRWKELASKYENWRKLIIMLDGGQETNKTPLPQLEEKKRSGKKTLAEVCKEQLKRRPWKDVHKKDKEPASDPEEDEEIVVDDNGMVKKIRKKKSKAYLKSHTTCHVCNNRHPNWKMAFCTQCDRAFCYGTLFRGWDKMPLEIMQDPSYTCPHCLGICFAGGCKRDPNMVPYQPKGTLLGHDTKKIADVRSVEALVDFSVSNLNWLKDDDPENRADSRRLMNATQEAQKAKQLDPTMEADGEEDGQQGGVEETQVEFEEAPVDDSVIDPALGGTGGYAGANGFEDEDAFARRLQQATNSALPPPAAMVAGAPVDGGAPYGYAAVSHGGYVPPAANMYPQPDDTNGYAYPGYGRPQGVEPADQGSSNNHAPEVSELRPFKRQRVTYDADDEDAEFEDISMTKHPKAKGKVNRLNAAGFRSSDLADSTATSSKARNELQRQYEREKERKALEKAKNEGRFIKLTAALKNKKRIVTLRVPGNRLAQLLAQQAAKVAMNEGEDPPEHEVQDGDMTQRDREVLGDEGNGEPVLKSDIVPKRTKESSKALYQQKQRDGRVLTGTTKKALVPVEKDESYRAHGGDPTLAMKPKREGREARYRRKRDVEYEEVDIGSDDDPDGPSLFVSQAGPSASANKERRALPGYLRDRHDEIGDGDYPNELSVQYKDRANKKKRASNNFPGTSLAATAQGALDAGTNDAAAGNGDDWMDVDQVAPPEQNIDPDLATATPQLASAQSPQKSSPRPTSSSTTKKNTGRPRGRPRKNPIADPMAAFNTPSNKANPAASAQQQRQNEVEEDNRLAKLRALGMVTDDGDANAPFNRSFVKGGLSAGDALEGSDDEMDD